MKTIQDCKLAMQELNQQIELIIKKYSNNYTAIATLANDLIFDYLEMFKAEFLHNPNLSQEQEIYYFKHVKCHLTAMMQFYSMTKDIEYKKPAVKKVELKKYYLKKLCDAKENIFSEEKYHAYLISGCTKEDNRYFLRTDKDVKIWINHEIVICDKKYATPYDHIFSRVEAYDLLKKYLKQKIKSFSSSSVDAPPQPALIWTSSKVNFIELIYALYADGAFNNGKSSLKEIVEFFEKALDMDLKYYNSSIHEIKSRKTQPTKYLNSLQTTLSKKIKDTENDLFI